MLRTNSSFAHSVFGGNFQRRVGRLIQRTHITQARCHRRPYPVASLHHLPGIRELPILRIIGRSRTKECVAKQADRNQQERRCSDADRQSYIPSVSVLIHFAVDNCQFFGFLNRQLSVEPYTIVRRKDLDRVV